MRINKVDRISLSGGLIGMLLTNPRKALDEHIYIRNREGWKATYILEHSYNNVAAMLLALIVLVATAGLWTFGPGYLILFEKESS